MCHCSSKGLNPLLYCILIKTPDFCDIYRQTSILSQGCKSTGFNCQGKSKNAWEQVETTSWEPNVEYEPWAVVEWDGQFFALLNTDEIDLTVNPMESDNWGLIGEYDPEYAYEFKDTEYVAFDSKVWIPTMLPTADTLKEGFNFRYHDPRNPNIKKHMIKIALYELHKLISPNNVSQARITDYEATMQWLHDANRCKINPHIQRKLDEEKKPVSEIAMATFQCDYAPYKNPWQI